jgi:hypothetical protein
MTPRRASISIENPRAFSSSDRDAQGEQLPRRLGPKLAAAERAVDRHGLEGAERGHPLLRRGFHHARRSQGVDLVGLKFEPEGFGVLGGGLGEGALIESISDIWRR